MKNLKEIIEITEKRLENPDMTPTSRAREEAHLYHHKAHQRILAEEKGSVNTVEALEYFMEGHMINRITHDKLRRHKWPEEKPKLTDWYLVECVSGGKWNEVVYWKDGCFFIDQRCLRKAFNEAITHWWNLPEVTE